MYWEYRLNPVYKLYRIKCVIFDLYINFNNFVKFL